MGLRIGWGRCVSRYEWFLTTVMSVGFGLSNPALFFLCKIVYNFRQGAASGDRSMRRARGRAVNHAYVGVAKEVTTIPIKSLLLIFKQT